MRSGSTWTLQAKLMAGDGAASDGFGSSVALSVSTALVGAVGDNNQGAAYVYTRSGSDWTQQAKLMAGDGAAGDEFGISAALSGDTAVVGAWLDDIGTSDRGSAYVYTRNGSTWTQQAKLTAGDGTTSDRLGLSVALSGSTALVGAHFDDIGTNENQGSSYVYSRSGSSWTQQAQLTSGDGAANDRFGIAVALFGDTALVGAHLDDIGASDQGAAYVYTRSGSTWTLQDKLTPFDGEANDEFGHSVALSGDTALIGALRASVGANIGRAND
ncbi:MAG: FG-GAP repeat protein [Pseudomarimonas sp.]